MTAIDDASEVKVGPAQPPRPVDPEISLRSTVGAVTAGISTAGDMMRFSWLVFRALPDLRRHSSEVFRQTAVLILSSAVIIWGMEFVVGTMCGTEAIYTLKQVGAPLYSGIFNSFCALREMTPYMWGYIMSAKVGCGLVAEIGSMRIADEIDAMEVMGINSRSYLVGTRILAVWIATPFLYAVSLGMMSIGEILMTVYYVGGVSPGGEMQIFWSYQNPYDYFCTHLKALACSTCIVFVGCYYGYHSTGGSVGVGKNTARSMMVNMVMVHVIGMLGTALFWGVAPNAPIAN
jgi:phospholipid/cholesterol/gamma-HCH transport system permease protein